MDDEKAVPESINPSETESVPMPEEPNVEDLLFTPADSVDDSSVATESIGTNNVPALDLQPNAPNEQKVEENAKELAEPSTQSAPVEELSSNIESSLQPEVSAEPIQQETPAAAPSETNITSEQIQQENVPAESPVESASMPEQTVTSSSMPEAKMEPAQTSADFAAPTDATGAKPTVVGKKKSHNGLIFLIIGIVFAIAAIVISVIFLVPAMAKSGNCVDSSDEIVCD